MIREAVLSDFEAVSALETQVFKMHLDARPDLVKPREEPLTFEQYQKYMDDSDMKVFIFEEGGAVLGHCITRRWESKDHPVYTDKVVLEIDDLCVEEKARGKSVGKCLFERAKEYAREISADRVELTVWDFNQKAKGFYEHLGMKTRITRMEYKI